MKRGWLAGLMLVQGWAGACSPIPPSAEVQRANEKLWQGISSDQSACRSKSQTECTVYRLSAQQVALLLSTQSRTKSFQSGTTWNAAENISYGYISRIRPIAGGSLVQTIDRKTAYEFISETLDKIRIPKSLWLNCSAVGLAHSSAYKIQDCRWQNGIGSSTKIFTFTIIASNDPSLPKGRYNWFPNDGTRCGASDLWRDKEKK